MGKDYKKIPAIGQVDPTACWLACLSWWLKAVRDVTKSQADLMMIIGAVWNQNGTINVGALKGGIARNNAIFKMQTEIVFADSLQYWIGDSKPRPTIVGFTTPGNTAHMNVIYDFNQEWNSVSAMEAWYPDLPINSSGNFPYIEGDAKFTGTHIGRWINYYQQSLKGNNGIFVGVPND